MGNRSTTAALVPRLARPQYLRYLTTLVHCVSRQSYKAPPVRRTYIPKADGSRRPLGIFDPSSFGYRKGRKTAADALTKIWREVEAGNEWIVDADLKDYFGSVDHIGAENRQEYYRGRETGLPTADKRDF